MELAETVSAATAVTPRKIATGYSWPEIPRWHDGAFYFSDMYNHRIVRLADDGAQNVLLDASQRRPLSVDPDSEDLGDTDVVLGGMGWLPDGRLVVTSMNERILLVWDGKALELYADLRHLAIGPINDMVVDTVGRAYVTQLGYNLFRGEEPREAHIIVVEPDGRARNLEELGVFGGANGITISTDGSRVITAEVLTSRLTTLDRSENGSLTNRRVFADTPWLPDGICLDEDGGVWAGLPGSGVVARFVEGGEMTHVVPIPMEEGMGVACVFGGPERGRLYICAGLEVFDWPKSRAEGLGSIWVAETDFTGGGNRP
jgi:sugar lactone lactonase YvrE